MSVPAISHFPLPQSVQSTTAKPVRSVLSPVQKRLRAVLQARGRDGTLPPVADQFFGAAYAAASQVYGPKVAPRIFFRLFPDAFILELMETMLENRAASIKAFFESWGESLRLNAELDRKAAEKSQDDRRQMLATATARKAAADSVLHAAQKAAQIAPTTHVGAVPSVQGAAASPTIGAPTSVKGATGTAAIDGVAASFGSEASNLLSNVATLHALDLPADDIGPALGSPKDRERQHNAKPLK